MNHYLKLGHVRFGDLESFLAPANCWFPRPRESKRTHRIDSLRWCVLKSKNRDLLGDMSISYLENHTTSFTWLEDHPWSKSEKWWLSHPQRADGAEWQITLRQIFTSAKANLRHATMCAMFCWVEILPWRGKKQSGSITPLRFNDQTSKKDHQNSPSEGRWYPAWHDPWRHNGSFRTCVGLCDEFSQVIFWPHTCHSIIHATAEYGNLDFWTPYFWLTRLAIGLPSGKLT